jgi:hypothetical protein
MANAFTKCRHKEKRMKSKLLGHLSPKLVRALGWFSIGLGIAEILAPRTISRASGMSERPMLVRAYGIRELACGIGLLVAKNPTPFVWARVAGDSLDLATVVINRDSRQKSNTRRAGALANLLGVTAVDVYASVSMLTDKPEPKKYEYGSRSGFSQPVEVMRGAALKTFTMPEDLRTPSALRPLNS